jgi:hypothetical protein
VLAILAVIAYAGILLVLLRIWRMGVVSDRSAAAMFLFNLPLLVTAIAIGLAPSIILVTLIAWLKATGRLV